MFNQEEECTSPEVELTSHNETISSEETENEEDVCSTKTLRYTSPLPMHRWVQLVDPNDHSINPLSSSYLPYSPWGTLNPYNSPEDQETGYVGIATLPCQIQQKAVKKGFEFTLMVVGESGLGKSTLINSLFLTDVNTDRTLFDAQERIHKTVAIMKNTVNIVEKGVKLRLNIVDTPGFGEELDNSNSWKAVVDYIELQFEKYRRAEISLNRKNMQDNRVHCCLYFISPYGHGLKPIDVEFMKALHEKVNIVPVLAKADCFTRSEIHTMKTRILDELDTHRIKIYQFPECDIDDDELFKKNDLELKRSIPFAVIGSNTIIDRDGRKFRGRLYPWGFVEVENPAHCDFVHLRNMLICTHMQDLKDMTEDTLYERYRTRILCQGKVSMW